MRSLTLVVLAAGMGSRYGGLKQLDGVGPRGEVLMEYSVHDALKAGVDRVVFVIRESFEEDFRRTILSRLPSDLDVRLAFQEFTDLPEGTPERIDPGQREKPWGTGHAVWTARHQVETPFMAINADDYYGPQAFGQLARHLSGSERPNPCMVGFRLSNTLSPSGTVSRGVCRVEDGALTEIVERTKLHRKNDREVEDQESGAVYSDDRLVSMNCWGFDHSFMDYLGVRFARFLRSIQGDPEALRRGEFYLPAAVDDWRKETSGEVSVLVTEDAWLGVTYPEDKETVVRGLRERIAEGTYPEQLWS